MQIKVYNNIQDLKGIGEEWLVDLVGDVIAVFIDGNLKCQVLYGDFGDKTKAA
jgi:hypothetical protein